MPEPSSPTVVRAWTNNHFPMCCQWVVCHEYRHRDMIIACHKQVSRGRISNYISHYLWDVITCPCTWCMLIALVILCFMCITNKACPWNYDITDQNSPSNDASSTLYWSNSRSCWDGHHISIELIMRASGRYRPIIVFFTVDTRVVMDCCLWCKSGLRYLSPIYVYWYACAWVCVCVRLRLVEVYLHSISFICNTIYSWCVYQ